MARTNTLIRANSLTDLVANVNAFLSTQLTQLIVQAVYAVVDEASTYGQEYSITLQLEDGGATLSSPFQLQTFTAANPSTAMAAFAAYVLASPSVFVSQPRYWPFTTERRRVNLYPVVAFTCADAANAADNWLADTGVGLATLYGFRTTDSTRGIHDGDGVPWLYRADSELTVNVLANAYYEFELFLAMNLADTAPPGRINMRLLIPAGAFWRAMAYGPAAPAETPTMLTQFSEDGITQEWLPSAAISPVETVGIIRGTLYTAAAAGTFAVGWHGSDDADPSSILRGSYLKLQQMR